MARQSVKPPAIAAASGTLETAGMSGFPPTDDPLVAALQALLAREGGHVAVADATGIGDQTLYQIAYLKPHSKSGKPKSVGPSVRARLSARYPDWMSAHLQQPHGCATLTAQEASKPYLVPLVRPPSLAQSLEALGMALAVDMPDDVREDLAELLAKLARRRGATRHQEEVLRLMASVSGKRASGGA